jgi:Ran GTPase-activating protein 1
MAHATVFSLEGQGLKLETAADIAPHLEPLEQNHAVEEASFGGNTFGIGACEKLAEVLESKKTLKVSLISLVDVMEPLLTVRNGVDS